MSGLTNAFYLIVVLYEYNKNNKLWLKTYFSHLPEQNQSPYRVGKLEDLEENKYRASLFIDMINQDPMEEMKKTHQLVVKASDAVLVR